MNLQETLPKHISKRRVGRLFFGKYYSWITLHCANIPLLNANHTMFCIKRYNCWLTEIFPLGGSYNKHMQGYTVKKNIKRDEAFFPFRSRVVDKLIWQFLGVKTQDLFHFVAHRRDVTDFNRATD